MDEETRVAQLGDLFCQQLHSLHRVAEDDTLVDLELGDEEGGWMEGEVIAYLETSK